MIIAQHHFFGKHVCVRTCMKLRSSPKLGNCGSGGECARPALALPRPDAELPQAAMLGPLCSGDDSPDVPEKPRSASSGSGLAGDSGGVCACTGRCGALCADVSMCTSRATCANATSAPRQHNAEKRQSAPSANRIPRHCNRYRQG